MESKKTTLYLDDFHGECDRPKINVVIRYLKQSSLIGVKYTKSFMTVNWLYDITVVVRIVVVQTNLGRP